MVDGEWRCCNLQTITKDNLGNENNCLEVSASLSAPLARVATPSLPLLCFPPVLPLCSQLDTQCWCTLALRTSPLRAAARLHSHSHPTRIVHALGDTRPAGSDRSKSRGGVLLSN